eukprot:2192114-Amphidinium_carterae.1
MRRLACKGSTFRSAGNQSKHPSWGSNLSQAGTLWSVATRLKRTFSLLCALGNLWSAGAWTDWQGAQAFEKLLFQHLLMALSACGPRKMHLSCLHRCCVQKVGNLLLPRAKSLAAGDESTVVSIISRSYAVAIKPFTQ